MVDVFILVILVLVQAALVPHAAQNFAPWRNGRRQSEFGQVSG